MDHAPFEDWLLSGDALQPNEQEALDRHLETCPDCPKLARAWQEVHAEIRRAPQAAPALGFTNRFTARLEAAAVARQRRLTWQILGGFILAGLGAGAFLLYQRADTLPTFVQVVSAGFNLYHSLTSAGRYAAGLVRGLPVPFTVGAWVLISTSLLFWVLTWFLLIWRLPGRKGVLYEKAD